MNSVRLQSSQNLVVFESRISSNDLRRDSDKEIEIHRRSDHGHIGIKNTFMQNYRVQHTFIALLQHTDLHIYIHTA